MEAPGFTSGSIRSPATFHQRMGMTGGKAGPDDAILQRVFARTGAYVMGRRMFDEGSSGSRWRKRLIPDSAVAIVAGATGLVGQELVRQLAADSHWREVRALVRHPLPPDLSRSNVISVPINYDRLDPPPLWGDADQVFCALGTTMRQAGSAEAFRRVDLEYPLALARAVLARGTRHFLLVTAVGAAPDSRFFYNRVKGEAEAAITALGFRSVTIARPSLLLGPRRETRLGEQLGRVLGLLAPPRWRPVRAAQVARALIEAARRDVPRVRILENRELRAADAI